MRARGLPRQQHQARQLHRGRRHRLRIHLRHGRQLGAPHRRRAGRAGRARQVLSRLPRRRTALPTEDCGSVPGYYEFLDAIAGPDKGKGSRQKKEMLAWYGRPYDPDDIDEAQIRSALKRIANARRRGRSKPVNA